MNELPASPGLLAEHDRADRAHRRTLERDRAGGRRSRGEEPLRGKALAIDCAGIGAALGGTCGVVVSAWAAMDSLVLPALDIVIAGPLAAALIGGAAGALAGVLSGALVEVCAARRARHAAARASTR